jgi:hypothetical protein
MSNDHLVQDATIINQVQPSALVFSLGGKRCKMEVVDGLVVYSGDLALDDAARAIFDSAWGMAMREIVAASEERASTYAAINSERDYQDAMTSRTDRPDMIDPMPLPAILLAMEKCLLDARTRWYSDAAPYQDTMQHVRKIAGLAVKAGERYGMPPREPING